MSEARRACEKSLSAASVNESEVTDEAGEGAKLISAVQRS